MGRDTAGAMRGHDAETRGPTQGNEAGMQAGREMACIPHAASLPPHPTSPLLKKSIVNYYKIMYLSNVVRFNKIISSEIHRTPLESDRTCWTPVESNRTVGICWIPSDSVGVRWSPIGFCRSPMESYRIPSDSVGVRWSPIGFRWSLMDSVGVRWSPIGLRGGG